MKIFSTILVLGLLLSGNVYAVKDMKLTCASNSYMRMFFGKLTKDTNNYEYEINIINKKASLIHSTKLILNNFDDLPLFSETDEEYIFIFDQTTSSTSNYSKIQFDRIRASGFIGVSEYLKKNVLDSEKSEFITLKNCRASEVNAKAKF
tara:strand:- start:96 stop:542 length:447 start_codon:yes stop_codon:yes gene_type:complete